MKLGGWLLGLVALAGCARGGGDSPGGNGGRSAVQSYGTKVRYAKGQALQFPDFTLTFNGMRHVSHPVFRPGFTYYDFTVKQGASTKTVSWSSGTGDIGPAAFDFGGQRYTLERAHSDKLGKLADDEVVVNQAGE